MTRATVSCRLAPRGVHDARVNAHQAVTVITKLGGHAYNVGTSSGIRHHTSNTTHGKARINQAGAREATNAVGLSPVAVKDSLDHLQRAQGDGRGTRHGAGGEHGLNV